jgi:SagB-type dehydrogenase family enzyme
VFIALLLLKSSSILKTYIIFAVNITIISMELKNLLLPALAAVIIIITYGCMTKNRPRSDRQPLTRSDNGQLTYTLPSPSFEGTVSVEKAIARRRSHRSYIGISISAEDLSQILWAAYGITKPLSGYPHTMGGLRTAPSAGALYPLQIYVLIGNVKGIEPGVYKYFSQGHKIVRVIDKDVRSQLCSAALNQSMIKTAPACIFYSADFSVTTQVYGNRGRERYVCIDLGHSAENVYLQVEALHLGTCAIGAFNDSEVRAVMQLPENEEPLYIMPIGRYFPKSEF